MLLLRETVVTARRRSLEIELHDDLRYRLSWRGVVYENQTRARIPTFRSVEQLRYDFERDAQRQLEIRARRGAATRSTASRRHGTAVHEGRAMRPLEVLSFPDLPARSCGRFRPPAGHCCRSCSAEGPLSIYELAKRLERDYKNVHTDVTQLGRAAA